jgi:serine/threonine protein kinase
VPREFMERGKASPKVDIYSFGLMILEMVTGKSRRTSSSDSLDNSNHYGAGLIKLVCKLKDIYETAAKIHFLLSKLSQLIHKPSAKQHRWRYIIQKHSISFLYIHRGKIYFYFCYISLFFAKSHISFILCGCIYVI